MCRSKPTQLGDKSCSVSSLTLIPLCFLIQGFKVICKFPVAACVRQQIGKLWLLLGRNRKQLIDTAGDQQIGTRVGFYSFLNCQVRANPWLEHGLVGRGYKGGMVFTAVTKTLIRSSRKLQAEKNKVRLQTHTQKSSKAISAFSNLGLSPLIF